MIAALKCCARCKQTKAAAHFARNRALRDGLGSWCKACVSAANNERYHAKHPEARQYASRHRRVEVPDAWDFSGLAGALA